MTTIVKRRDRRFLMWRVINPDTGGIQDLTGCTIRLLVCPQYSEEEPTPYVMAIEGPPTDGVVKYWYDGTIDEGMYEIEVEATNSSANTLITSPTEGYNLLQVEADLG